MDLPDKVTKLINHLTKDEDQRQNLWVHYLSGHSPQTFASHLEKINRESLIEQELQAQLWYALKNPPSEKFYALLSQLSDVEQSIACLLALGLTVGQLSEYKGISQIRIMQVISVMKENDCWEELYAEEKVNRGRAPRT